MKPFYITTAIFYTNAAPHLGHAYEMVLTDVIARFRRQMGDQVHFLTGTDEYGQKVQASARKQGVPPQEFVTGVSAQFQALLPRLNVANDDFIRTTEERHKRVVREILQKLYDQGDIYLDTYRGYYSARQEQFLQEKDRNPDGSWPEIFGEVTELTESNYFFRLKQHQPWLVEFLTAHEKFIFPAYRRNQVLEFLKEPLNDLCISRPRERLEWGIPLPGGLLVHGWWSQRGAKMSKSTGNTVDPLALVDEFGADAFRYFLIREMNVGQDSDFTREQFLVRYNSELANNLGNLVNRTLNMTTRFVGGAVPAPDGLQDLDRELRALWEKTRDEFIPLCEAFQFHTALERAMFFLAETNAYIEKRAPWKLGKSAEPADQALLRTTLATMAEALRLAVTLIRHVTPASTERIHAVLGYTPGPVWRDELVWGEKLTGAKVAESLVLFPRPAPQAAPDKPAKK